MLRLAVKAPLIWKTNYDKKFIIISEPLYIKSHFIQHQETSGGIGLAVKLSELSGTL